MNHQLMLANTDFSTLKIQYDLFKEATSFNESIIEKIKDLRFFTVMNTLFKI